MKKILLAMLCLVMVLGFCACGGSSSDGESGGDGDAQSAAAFEIGDGTAVAFEDSIGSKWVQIIVPVTNTGSVDLYLEPGKIDLEDEEGNLVKSIDLVDAFPQILKPGETTCYYQEEALDCEPGQTFKVIPHLNITESTVEGIRFDVSELSIKDQEYIGGVEVMGRVENSTDEDANDMTYISAVFYDADNNIIASTFTISDTILKAGEKMGFELMTFSVPESVNTDNVDHYDVFAYPTQYQEY